MAVSRDKLFLEAREKMLKEQIVKRGIKDRRVLAAMYRVPRHLFVDQTHWVEAYADKPLPIGFQQTISQPYMVAFMSTVLQLPVDGSGVVLEIGTGSGYQTAILSHLARKVYSVERIPSLADQARRRLAELGITNVEIKVTDGGYGWPANGPYDGILSAAAAPQMPAPLQAQLKEGARLIAPVGSRKNQKLIELLRQGNSLQRRELMTVAFVPLIGEHGWEAPGPDH